MNNKQSSVEKLAELIRLTNKEVYAELFDEIEQIKSMHMEEIESTYDDAIMKGRYQEGVEYYKETFGE